MVTSDEKAIVLARLQTMPSNMSLSVGGAGAFDKWQLIEHVKKGDSTGQLIVQVYMENLRAFKEVAEGVQ
ncbi:hypothetical protein COX85_03285 [Candidatus Micrarchaeota archaeon CG_4_10_14_0_2_um_filter_55_9]|nr:MAG: hypothetical protein AUJ15_03520 [Candidatus Micrarchaeota archaeon CG1_02_55_41]PIO03674.1 MAG: hypothetical protein COT57_00415 [Candidatus Micrarchaeota archaeon CG09_land_8_20_14_0_10_55_25]PIZ91549.1 MAG: hypothetical protein COX85_03285 [Candidatus Micrarchaeota archaeon CG_4_10_14_0_2_um_filter_55_9]PJD01406.1 MAG: hypothetical protein COU38_01170 [Candidatus Micrarchaeota archaeon CG10_big_fil_rev_8_21_14_0_10_54_18]